MAEIPETRGSTVNIPIPEYAGKWVVGTRLAAKHNTRKIGIEERKDKVAEVSRATREFNKLVHSRMEDLMKDLYIQAGVEASYGHVISLSDIAKKLIAYKVKGRIVALEEELKRVPDRYKPIVLSLINDPQLIEAYKRIIEAKRK